MSIDLTGQQFGRLTVIGRGDKSGRHWRWLCVCACGTIKNIATASLRSGASKSCGCLMREIAKQASTVHGKSGTPTHKSWTDMRDRCRNKNSKIYRYYGGRGITICERWNKFENFLSDMGERPEGTSIDRIDSNGNYSPENCRWATRVQQSSNTRSVRHYVECDGETVLLAEACRRKGVRYRSAWLRKKNGVPDELLLCGLPTSGGR